MNPTDNNIDFLALVLDSKPAKHKGDKGDSSSWDKLANKIIGLPREGTSTAARQDWEPRFEPTDHLGNPV